LDTSADLPDASAAARTCTMPPPNLFDRHARPFPFVRWLGGREGTTFIHWGDEWNIIQFTVKYIICC